MELAADVLLEGGKLRHVKPALNEVKSAQFIVGTRAPTVTKR